MPAMSSTIRYGMLLQTKKNKKNQDTTIMKAKYALIALLAITFWGCDDNTAGLGLGMFPGSDQNINGKLSTFDVTTESVHAGKIYAMTNVGYVGKFTDETFGTYQAGFLAELNCPTGMTFPGVYDGTALDEKKKATRVMVDKEGLGDDVKPIYNTDNENDPNRKLIGNIHTIELYLWYSSYFGDSLTACRLSVYELGEAEEELNQENAYYTDIEPEKFYNPKNLLGTKAYTAVDLSVKDSIRKLSTYVPSVHVSFKQDAAIEIGTKIIQKANEFGINFDDKTFREIFKGIYVKSDYGDGTVLYINQAQMNVVYKCYAVDTLTGVKLKKKVLEEGDTEYKDSTYYGYRTFTTTREVIQANQLQNDKAAIQNCINNPEWTYLKSPAGIFTQLTLPVSQIAEKLQGDTLNAVKLGIPKLSTLPRTTKLDKYIANLIKANREAYKGILTKKIPPLFICSSEEYKNNLKQLYSIMIKLIDTVKEVDKRLMEEKNERNSYTFSDTEHFAINLLFSIDGDKIVKKDFV